MHIEFIKHPSKLIILTLAVLTSLAAQAGEVTSTFTAGDTLTATKMTEIKDAVNDNNAKILNNIANIGTNSAEIGSNTTNIGINSADISAHDARITDLENTSPAIGRIAVSVSDGTPTKTLADAVQSSAISDVFPTPSDYVSGTVTIKALISGCGGSNVSVSISKGGVNAGSNSLIFIIPTFQTVSIPANGTFSFSVVEVTMTTTSLTDLNTISLTRSGANATDSCSTNLTVQGFIVEYPRG